MDQKKVAGINYSAANCKIFLAYFNSESKASLFTDAHFSNWWKKDLHKTFFKVPQRREKIKIYINLYCHFSLWYLKKKDLRRP